MKSMEYFNKYRDKSQLQLVGPLTKKGQSFQDPVIFVDGGSAHRHGDEGWSIGDGDSGTDKMDVQLATDKDQSDLAVALEQIPTWFNEIRLIGFLGGRKDHELINFGEVHSFLETRIEATKVYFEQSIMALSAGTWDLDRKGTFSLIGLRPTGVKLTGGIKYPIAETEILSAFSSRGLSNEASDPYRLEIRSPVFLFYQT